MKLKEFMDLIIKAIDKQYDQVNNELTFNGKDVEDIVISRSYDDVTDKFKIGFTFYDKDSIAEIERKHEEKIKLDFTDAL